jgi:hypothetical protein
MEFSRTDHACQSEKPAAVLTFEPRNSADSPATVRHLRVALVGNFAPRKCGIATFTTDIFERMGIYQPEVTLDVYALQDRENPVDHGPVHAELLRDDPEAYARAARRMNEDGVDALWLQHEFGIFGGDCGEQVLDLVDRVAAPLIVTMHTVLSNPSAKQEAIMRRLIARASRLMVMCRAGRDLLVARYGADERRIAVIEHGAPDRSLRLEREGERDARRTLLTFGLLGPGKGLETAPCRPSSRATPRSFTVSPVCPTLTNCGCMANAIATACAPWRTGWAWRNISTGWIVSSNPTN